VFTDLLQARWDVNKNMACGIEEKDSQFDLYKDALVIGVNKTPVEQALKRTRHAYAQVVSCVPVSRIFIDNKHVYLKKMLNVKNETNRAVQC
jgi:hypothetical protein